MQSETATGQVVVNCNQVKELLFQRLVESGAQPGEKWWTEAELFSNPCGHQCALWPAGQAGDAFPLSTQSC